MAEFIQVMDKAKKICNYYDNCKYCPLREKYCTSIQDADISDYEEVVMAWKPPTPILSKSELELLPIDTAIEVSEDQIEWVRRHFAKYESGENLLLGQRQNKLDL